MSPKTLMSKRAKNELVFYAFDLVRLDGWNLAAAPLVERTALLRQLLAGATGRSATAPGWRGFHHSSASPARRLRR